MRSACTARAARGIAERDGVMHRIDVIEGTLGKAFGVHGRLYRRRRVASSMRCAATLRASSSPRPCRRRRGRRHGFRPAPQDVAGRARGQQRQVAQRQGSADPTRACRCSPTPTHIVPVMVGDAEACKAACDRLLSKHGIYIQPINYPTVPRGTERLRITPGPLHTDDHVEVLTQALVETWQALSLPFGGLVLEARERTLTARRMERGQ